MSWIFVGILLGATVTFSTDNRETCEGKRVLLLEQKVRGDCHEINRGTLSIGTSVIPFYTPTR